MKTRIGSKNMKAKTATKRTQKPKVENKFIHCF